MTHVDGLCSNARPDEPESMDGIVEYNSAKAFTFIVIPLEVGDYTISIYMFSSPGNDAVQKVLHVVVSVMLHVSLDVGGRLGEGIDWVRGRV